MLWHVQVDELGRKLRKFYGDVKDVSDPIYLFLDTCRIGRGNELRGSQIDGRVFGSGCE